MSYWMGTGKGASYDVSGDEVVGRHRETSTYFLTVCLPTVTTAIDALFASLAWFGPCTAEFSASCCRVDGDTFWHTAR